MLDKYSKGDNVESEIIANANREGISEETQLNVHTEKYLKNNQEYKALEVEGFTLMSPTAGKIPIFDFSDLANQRLSKLDSALSTKKAGQEIEISELLPMALGRTREFHGHTFYLIDANTLIETIGSRLYKVIISPGLLAEDYIVRKEWAVKDFYYGQSKEEVIKKGGKSSFSFSDSVIFEYGAGEAKVFFTKEGDTLVAHSMEITAP